MAIAQEAVRISSIIPNLTVDDLAESIKFYEGLGFTIDERWEDNGKLLGVMLRGGNSQIGLEPGRLEERARPEEGRRRARLHVDYTATSMSSPSVRRAPGSRSFPNRTTRNGRAARSRSPIRAAFC